MEEFAKKKGKEGTRGDKQIARENASTIQFYRNMILGKILRGIYMTLLLIGNVFMFRCERRIFFSHDHFGGKFSHDRNRL